MHPYEHALVYLLAFGPFVLLAVTIRISRRRDAAGSEGAGSEGAGSEGAGPEGERADQRR
jgi:hypothetical protein